MSVEFLRLTGDPIGADELEWTLWNTALFSLSPGGRWCVYNNCVGTLRGPVGAGAAPAAPSDGRCSRDDPAGSDGLRLSALVYAVGQTTPVAPGSGRRGHCHAPRYILQRTTPM
jgi:hypothetical protein